MVMTFTQWRELLAAKPDAVTYTAGYADCVKAISDDRTEAARAAWKSGVPLVEWRGTTGHILPEVADADWEELWADQNGPGLEAEA